MITVAAAIVVALAAVNVALALAGRSIQGDQQDVLVGGILFGGIMLALAVGLWQVRYWAAIGFQIVLGITALSAARGLLIASNLVAVLLCVGLLAGTGTLFWFLIRAMARIQAPRRG